MKIKLINSVQYLPFLLLFGCYIVLVPIQSTLTSYKEDSWHKEKFSYLPNDENIKPFMLGFSSTYANYLWIKTMLYFGEHYSSDSDYAWLTSMLDIITKLNPYFYPAYEFAGIMVPYFTEDIDAAIIILNRGISHFGQRKYTLPFYLGWIHYDRLKNYELASFYMLLAANSEQSPQYIKDFSKTLLHTNSSYLSQSFLYSIYNSTHNPTIKNIIRKKIQLFNQSNNSK